MVLRLFKKIIICFLALQLAFFSPFANANASPGGWTFSAFDAVAGVVSAVKNGAKATATVAKSPVSAKIGKGILGGVIAGAALPLAISQITGIALTSLDWVLDPANNAIKYRDPTALGTCTANVGGINYSGDISVIENAYLAHLKQDNETTYLVSRNLRDAPYVGYYLSYAATQPADTWGYVVGCTAAGTSDYKSIPIPTVAQKIYDIAKSGNTNAQADVTSAVTELVNSGAYDTPINQAIQDAVNNGTLPKDTDTNTNPDTNTNTQIDTSSIIAAIQSLESAFSSAISNAFNGITSVINTSIDKLLNKQDQMQGEVVNVGSKVDSVGGQVVGVGDKVDSVGGKVVGVGEAVKDVGGKVVGLNDSVDKIGDKVVGVGDKVTAGTDAVGTKVDAVGDKVTGVGADVRGVGDKVTATGDKVTDAVTGVGDKVTGVGTRVDAVGDKVDAASDKVADAVKESTKEITKKMDETKPKDFELPAFCDWAKPVCDFIDWFKADPDIEGTPVPTDNTPLKNPSEFDKDYVSVVAQCPPDVVSEIPLPGQSFNLVFGMSPVCDFASTYLRPVIIFLAYIYGALSIGNAFRVGG